MRSADDDVDDTDPPPDTRRFTLIPEEVPLSRVLFSSSSAFLEEERRCEKDSSGKDGGTMTRLPDSTSNA